MSLFMVVSHCEYFVSVLEVANKEYGDFNPHLTKAAKDDRWRINSNVITDQLNSSFNHFPINGEKPAVHRNNSNESKEFHVPPSEWTKFLLLLGRCQIHYYRDWVRIIIRRLSSVKSNRTISSCRLLRT